MDSVEYFERAKSHKWWERIWWVSAVFWLLLSWTLIALIPLYWSIKKALGHSKQRKELKQEYQESDAEVA